MAPVAVFEHPEELEPLDAVAALPPMREPDLKAMRQEALVGCIMVPGSIAFCIAGTHLGIALMADAVPGVVPPVLLALVYAEAVVASACLVGLMFGDPGIIERSERSCLPLPREVAEKLQAGEQLVALSENIADGQRSFCVRCLVWRDEAAVDACPGPAEQLCSLAGCPDGRGFHHCRTCQRCVAHFDHHCSFFGRCIAGRGFGGNMGFFKVIIACGNLGGLTCAAAVFGGLCRTTWGYWIVVVVLGYCTLVCCSALVCVAGRTGHYYVSAFLEKRSRARRAQGAAAPPEEESGDPGTVIGAKGK